MLTVSIERFREIRSPGRQAVASLPAHEHNMVGIVSSWHPHTAAARSARGTVQELHLVQCLFQACTVRARTGRVTRMRFAPCTATLQNSDILLLSALQLSDICCLCAAQFMHEDVAVRSAISGKKVRHLRLCIVFSGSYFRCAADGVASPRVELLHTWQRTSLTH